MLRFLRLALTGLATAAVLAAGARANADPSVPLPSGDFTATMQSGSGAPFALRCTDGRCQFLGPGPRVESQALREFAQAPVVDLAHTETVSDGCAPRYVAYVEKLHIDGHFLSYQYDADAFKAEGKCGDTTYYINHRAEHDHFSATVAKIVDRSGDDLTPGSDKTSAPAAGGTAKGTNPPEAGSSANTATTSRLDSGAAAAPSVLSALPTASEVSLGAGHGLALAVVVLVLVLLIAFPTQLLNTAVETGQDKVSGWLRRRRGIPDEASRPPVASARTWLVAAAVVFAASLIGSFVDPGFGFNPGSLRVLLSLLVALSVETLLVWFTVLWLVRRTTPSTQAGFHAAPATLLVVLVAVVVTRLTGFEPGIIFGLVAGVTFATATSAAEEGRVAATGLGLGFGLALLGWLGYSFVGPSTDAGGLGHNLLSDTLAGLAISGIASLPLALVPIRSLPGHSLYAWSKPVWAVSYALALIGFFLVLMPMPFSWDAVHTSLETWVLLYLAYAAMAVGAWAAITQPWRRGVPVD